jgi:hypothetical protein
MIEKLNDLSKSTIRLLRNCKNPNDSNMFDKKEILKALNYVMGCDIKNRFTGN